MKPVSVEKRERQWRLEWFEAPRGTGWGSEDFKENRTIGKQEGEQMGERNRPAQLWKQAGICERGFVRGPEAKEESHTITIPTSTTWAVEPGSQGQAKGQGRLKLMKAKVVRGRTLK